MWLVAHYAQVRNYADQTDAQRHLADVAQMSNSPKALPCDLSMDDVEDAKGQCQLPNTRRPMKPNELPPLPGTAMPLLVDALRQGARR